MKRLRLIVAVALALTLIEISGLRADITPVNYPTPVHAATYISGNVTNIDPVNRMVQIKDDNGIIQTIRVNDRVQIMRRGETVKLGDISLGDFVTVAGL